jgi:hypothetical protein
MEKMRSEDIGQCSETENIAERFRQLQRNWNMQKRIPQKYYRGKNNILLLLFFLLLLLPSFSSSAGSTVPEEPWPLVGLLVIGPDPVIFVSNF